MAIDPSKTKIAEEYIIIYGFGPDRKPERVEGQYTIYDSKPGDEKYCPIWHHNYVIVPRNYTPQTLRSETDVRQSGYPVQETEVYTN